MATVFLASVVGWYLVVFGLLLLLRQEHMILVSRDILARRDVFFILALVTFLIGLLMVLSHNIWIMGWPVIVTVLSWLVLISGVIRLFFPEQAPKLGQSLLNKPVGINVLALILIVIGIYLLAHVYYW